MIARRRRSDGTLGYQLRVSVRGRRLPAETFDKLGDARRRERELQGLHAEHSWSREHCDLFAERWHDDYPIVKTGPTRGQRKSTGTLATNKSSLASFRDAFKGVQLIELANDRPRARAWARKHPRAAVVARGMLQDAVDDGLLPSNPLSKLQLEQSRGRRDHAPILEDEVVGLAQIAREILDPDFGARLAAFILFTFYTGPRIEEGCWLERDWISVPKGEVSFLKAKLSKPRCVLLPDPAAKAYVDMPKRIDLSHGRAFWTKTGKPLTKTNHFPSWDKVRAVWWSHLTEARRKELVDVDWHSLRHGTGYLFYKVWGYSDDDTAFQLGHSGTRLVHDLYGHGQHGALDRMKRQQRGTRPGGVWMEATG